MSDMNEYDMILLRSTSVRMHEEGESGRVCSSASGKFFEPAKSDGLSLAPVTGLVTRIRPSTHAMD